MKINYLEDEPKKLNPINIETIENLIWVNFTFDNKNAGLLTTRIKNDATAIFSDGTFQLSGNL